MRLRVASFLIFMTECNIDECYYYGYKCPQRRWRSLTRWCVSRIDQPEPPRPRPSHPGRRAVAAKLRTLPVDSRREGNVTRDQLTVHRLLLLADSVFCVGQDSNREGVRSRRRRASACRPRSAQDDRQAAAHAVNGPKATERCSNRNGKFQILLEHFA